MRDRQDESQTDGSRDRQSAALPGRCSIWRDRQVWRQTGRWRERQDEPQTVRETGRERDTRKVFRLNIFYIFECLQCKVKGLNMMISWTQGVAPYAFTLQPGSVHRD